MAIKKVWIEDGCDMAVVKEGVNYSDYEDGIKEAADSCPVEVIKFE